MTGPKAPRQGSHGSIAFKFSARMDWKKNGAATIAIANSVVPALKYTKNIARIFRISLAAAYPMASPFTSNLQPHLEGFADCPFDTWQQAGTEMLTPLMGATPRPEEVEPNTRCEFISLTNL